MKWIVFILFVLAALGFVGRETLVVGEGRRAGQDELKLYRRFRRRTKGALLLLFLLTLALFFEELASLGNFDARAIILYTGLALITLIWILMLAARDTKETAFDALNDARKIRTEAYEEIEHVIRERKGGADSASPRDKAPKESGE